MAFDPDAFIGKAKGFDPDAFIGAKKADEGAAARVSEAGKLSQLLEGEKILGGGVAGPNSVPASPEDVRAAKLAALAQEQAELQKEHARLDDQASTSAPESAALGALSPIKGITDIGSLVLRKAVEKASNGNPTPLTDPRARELEERGSQDFEARTSANPLAASAGAVGTNLATLGGGGGTASALRQGLYREAAKAAGKGAAVNAAVGAGTRTALDQDTSLKDLIADLTLGAAIGARGAKAPQLIEPPIPVPNVAPPTPKSAEPVLQYAGVPPYQQTPLIGITVRGAAPIAPAAVGTGPRLNAPPSAAATPPTLQSRLSQPAAINLPPASDIPKLAAVRPQASAPAQPRSVVERAKDAIAGGLERRKINAQEKAAERASIEALPPVARSAVENGVLPRDVHLFTNATRAEKSVAQEMLADAKRFTEDRTAKDPALIVGNELQARVQAMEKLKDQYGKQLGEYVKTLPKENGANAPFAVFKRLEQVPGLSGLKIDNDGNLDFTDTAISGSLTERDRATLQKAFSDVQNRTPIQLHKLRQELFEYLGGKKAAKMVVTETQDNGLEAIREGLADALNAASPEYKNLNQKFALAIAPLKDMRRFFRNSEGMTDDLLDMKASLLARRLTSNAASNPELQSLISNMEDQLAKNGVKFGTRVQTLQEMHNALSRYYDIARDTSLSGQMKLGTGGIEEGVNSIRGGLLNLGGKIAAKMVDIRKSDAVRRKYLEDLIGGHGGGKDPLRTQFEMEQAIKAAQRDSAPKDSLSLKED